MSDLVPLSSTDVGADEDRLRQWIALGSGIDSKDCIPGNQSDPEPSVSPYCVVTLINERSSGQPETIYHDGNSDTELDTEIRATVVASYDVQWLRKGARAAARTWRTWALSRAGQAAAELMGVPVFGMTELRQIDSAFEGEPEWEERIGLDVSLRYLHTVRVVTGRLVDIAGFRVDVDSGAHTVTEHIESRS